MESNLEMNSLHFSFRFQEPLPTLSLAEFTVSCDLDSLRNRLGNLSIKYSDAKFSERTIELTADAVSALKCAQDMFPEPQKTIIVTVAEKKSSPLKTAIDLFVALAGLLGALLSPKQNTYIAHQTVIENPTIVIVVPKESLEDAESFIETVAKGITSFCETGEQMQE